MTTCKKCHRSSPCGCSDTPFTTNYNYISCTCPQTCAEYVYTGCVIYNGPELSGLNVIPGMNLNQVIQAIYLYQIDPACITTTCHAPFVLISATTATSIKVSWASVAEATSYIVRYQEVASPGFVTLPAVSNSTTSLNITGLTCGTVYEIIVQATFSTTNCDSLTITASTTAC
jgi:hypothetical protein